MELKISVLTALLSMGIVYGSVFAGGDTKYYGEYALKHKLNDRIDLFFTPELRYNNDMEDLYYYHLRGGLTYHADKNLDFASAYRFIQTKDSKKDWSNNDTQYIELMAIPKIKAGDFNLSDANKIEYRFIENARDRWVYRNLATAAYPAKIGDFEFVPYVSDEVYYDFEINKVNLNWLTIGANKKISDNLTVGLYYRDETSRVGTSSKWLTNNILGTNVTVNF